MPEKLEDIKTQYSNDGNLNARIALHARFSTNTYGWQRWVFDHLTLGETARILELGCGPAGLWTANKASIPAGWSCVLTDFSTGMTSAATQNLAGIPSDFGIATADAQAIPAPDDTFDAVIANHMLYHVPDRALALQEMRRVLRPGGTVFATTIGENHMREMWNLIEPFVPDIHERTRKVSHVFTLENGGEQLGAVFSDVAREDYADDLAVTEVQPVVDYIRSSNTMVGCTLEPNQWAAIRRTIMAHIEVKGEFRIRKASGMLMAAA